jgi:hypothetical protein
LSDKILLAVQEFLKVHDSLESKYWPILDIFLERLEKKIPVKKIASDFHRAFRQIKKLGPEKKIPGYWYTVVNDVQRIALNGKEWFDEHRGLGFWTLRDLAKFELKVKHKPKKKDRIDDEHFDYFINECPDLFLVLFAAFTEEKRLPDIGQEQKEWRAYERMTVRMLDILLNDSTFFFSPEHNWPNLCHRILQQIKPARVPTIIDIETTINENS